MTRKIEIVPVVNCGDLKSVKDRLHAIEKISYPDGRVHLDIADGRFTFHRTWNDPAGWAALHPPHKVEVHLMVEEPELVLEDWLKAGAERVIVHYETVFDLKSKPDRRDDRAVYDGIRRMIQKYGAEFMLAHSPETPSDKLVYYSEGVHAFQVLAVHPGLAGQPFLPVALEKIKFLRQQFPDATIEVDGGVTPEIIRRAAAAGADTFTSDSFLFNHGDPQKNLAELQYA